MSLSTLGLLQRIFVEQLDLGVMKSAVATVFFVSLIYISFRKYVSVKRIQ